MNLGRADLHGANLGEDLSRDDKDLLGAILNSELNKAFADGAKALADRDTEALVQAQRRRARRTPPGVYGAHLREAAFKGADLRGADLRETDLEGANLERVDLHGDWFDTADLRGANLEGASLKSAALVDTDLTDANLTGCRVYGISAWDLKLEGAKQRNIVITALGQPEITVDNIEVGQFIYLLLHNEKIRNVIDTITSKAVLILGRFTPERKAVLDALREELRRRDYLPILFDFEKPTGRDITETVSLLARMARFVVADLTDAKSIPQELGVIVPDLPSVPVQPLLLEGSGEEYSMFEHFQRYPWVLATYVYASADELIANLAERVIGPAEAKAGR